MNTYVHTFISTTEANVVMYLGEPKTTTFPNKQTKQRKTKQVFGLIPKDRCNPSHSSRKLLFATNGNYYKSHNQSKYKVVEPVLNVASAIQLRHLRLWDHCRVDRLEEPKEQESSCETVTPSNVRSYTYNVSPT